VNISGSSENVSLSCQEIKGEYTTKNSKIGGEQQDFVSGAVVRRWAKG